MHAATATRTFCISTQKTQAIIAKPSDDGATAASKDEKLSKAKEGLKM